MTVSELESKLNLTVLCEGDLTRKVTGGYCGDLLSWVMGRAKEGDAWITVMGNINSIAVAVLSDVACIVLAENSTFDSDALERAKIQNITVFRSDYDQYTLAVKLSKLLKE